jgi:hypothetical protein
MQTANSKKWAVPIFLVAMGGVYLVAFWAGGEVWAGVGAAVFMVVVAVLLFFGGHSEVVRVLRGQPSDEMWRSFNMRAIWFASEVLAVVVVGAFVYEIARGQDGQPYALLGFVFAAAYVAALLWLRWRG